MFITFLFFVVVLFQKVKRHSVQEGYEEAEWLESGPKATVSSADIPKPSSQIELRSS